MYHLNNISVYVFISVYKWFKYILCNKDFKTLRYYVNKVFYIAHKIKIALEPELIDGLLSNKVN